MAQRDSQIEPQEFLNISAENHRVSAKPQWVRDMTDVPVITFFETGQGYVMPGNESAARTLFLDSDMENDAIVIECHDVFPDGLCVERASHVYPMAHRRNRRGW